MTTDVLLKRCLDNCTQNSNESMHSKLWMRASKNKFASLRRVKFLAQVVQLNHNFGFEAGDFLPYLGIETNVHERDNLRQLEKDCVRMNLPRAKGKKQKKKKKEQKTDNSYQPGGFHVEDEDLE